MEKAHRLVIFLLGILMTSHGLCQSQQTWPTGDSSGKFHLVVHPMLGQIVPHRKEMQHLIQGQSVGLSVQILRRKTFSWWGMYQRQPITGAELYYSSTGNPNQLGHQFAVNYLIYRPYINANRPLYYGLGLGLGYNTKTWDLNNNHQATVISSHLNACLVLHCQYPIFQTEKTDWLLGIRMTHLSNGAYQLPNLGTNNFQMTLANQPRMILNRRPITIIDILPGFHRSRFFSLTVAGGIKETFQPLGRKYPVGNVQFNFSKAINWRHRWSVGADYLYQPALQKLWKEYKGVDAAAAQCMQAGISVGYQSIFGFTTFSIQQGLYVYSPWKETGKVYHRLSIRRNFTHLPYYGKHGFWYAGLFTHWAKADHAEFGCGIDF
jgi:hypothetical protein